MYLTSVRFPLAVIVFAGAVLSLVNSARAASAAATVGQTVTFSVTADGTPPFSYQWYKDNTAISGATAASFSISSLKVAEAGTYCAFIANAAGFTISDNAVLAVYAATDAPVFTAQPVSQTAATAQSVAFSVTAGGSQTTTFQWQRLPAGSTTWENLVEGGSYRGVNTATLMVSAITTAMAGDQFRCQITNSSGSAASTAGALSVSGGSAALIQYPASIAEDAAGNLYVADASANTVEKISSTGAVSTLAGSAGLAGSQDGTGSNARFNQPTGVAIDGAGNLYVADTGNAMVRKITQDGRVSTVAGSAARGNQDGVGSTASFKAPTGIAVDSAGNLYVADAFNATIRKITSAGSVSTLAGMAGSRGDADGTGSAARFNYPCGVAVDPTGNVFVADTYNDTIRRIDSSGLVSTLAGSAGISGSNDGTGIYALFNQPGGITVDSSGNVGVADTGNATIRKISPGGTVITLAGVAGIAGLGNSSSGVVLFNQPRGLVVDRAGSLFIADTGNAAIRKISADGTVTTLTLAAASAATTTTPTPTTSPTTPVSGASIATTAGGGGGGGAMESSFVLMLILLAACRKAVAEKR
jgi:sugar lactone lactonase YvrE